MSGTITIIAVPVKDPDSFESMYIEERREKSGGWEEFRVGSGLLIDAFFMQATKLDLGVFMNPDDHDAVANGAGKLITCLIDQKSLPKLIPKLATLVEENTDKTAQALFEHGKKGGKLARIAAALKSEKWPTNGDPAEEAAAFAYQALKYARIAAGDGMGLCWEYRGEIAERGDVD